MVAGYKHLADMVFEGMKKESSPLHDPKLCALVQKLDPSTKVPKKTTKRTKKQAEEVEEVGENEGEEGDGAEEGQGQDGDGAAPKKKLRKGTNSSSGGGGGSSLNDLMTQLKNLRAQ